MIQPVVVDRATSHFDRAGLLDGTWATATAIEPFTVAP